MEKLILFLVLMLWMANCQELQNVVPMNMNGANDTNKDMYVIHAMVYQVGILTNSSDHKEQDNDTEIGAQEALTFYRSNGSSLDLSSISQPLLTNITGQSLVGLAPVSDAGGAEHLPWNAENPHADTGAPEHTRKQRDLGDDEDTTEDDSTEYREQAQKNAGDNMHLPYTWMKSFRKRDAKVGDKDTEKLAKVVNGNAVIPSGAGVQSVALPPLLSLNNNFSEIPVPIPNTSVVYYTRINTMITPANGTS